MDDASTPQAPEGPQSPVDGPLRDNVRRLGAAVGQMLVEQGGDALLSRVEAVRIASIRRRELGLPVNIVADPLRGLAPADAELMIRAFASYFQAVNVAERVHRIRRRRDYQRQQKGPQPDGLLDALQKLKAAGVSLDELLGWLDRLDVEPVFTAHPTEAVRRSLLEKESAIVRCLVDDFDPERTLPERRAGWEQLQMAMTAAWQTSESAPVKPEVQDELEHVGFYLGGPVYRVLPAFYEIFGEALSQVYGVAVELPLVLRFASWVGGDMDGNPNVGADTISASLVHQRAQVLGLYTAEVNRLAERLSQTLDRVGISNALAQRIENYRRRLPEASAAIRPRHANMPYRVFLTLVAARLRATRNDEDGGYSEPVRFIADIELVEESLRRHKGARAGAFEVGRLLRRARTFGFHLARLDVRQDSRVHTQALAALLSDPTWPEAGADQQALRLRPHAGREGAFRRSEDETAERMRRVFKTLSDAHDQYGSQAIGLYIISMARRAADVLAVLALARYGGFVNERGAVPLDIAPLFETIDDLEHGSETLRNLLHDPVYRAHLQTRDDHQIVMLGYSDSSKDGGIVASRWSLQRAQVELLEVAEAAGIRVSFFHGRGGSASRGGGRIMPALMSAPRGSVGGVTRVTEQGEVIHRKYGIRALALRELEQTVAATLLASVRPRAAEPREAKWKETMAALAVTGRRTYRDFVTAEGFVDYFRTATPIDVIERMALGSRPARRGTMKGVESLRAIPWVFAWTQSRSALTAWYGLGTALEAGAAEFGEEVLFEMAREWAFFSTFLADVDMVLAKSDLAIAERFSRLSGDLHARFFPLIEAEFERTRHWVLKLTGSKQLLSRSPRLAESIRLRNPYTDPMSVIQVDLLARWRESGGENDTLLHVLVASVNGVSQALQNTG